ncbi:MAG: PulJ/GspJ family protein [Candidatus Xenobia bacterium]
MGRAKGMTLVELAVFAMLTGLLLSAISFVMKACLTYFQTAQVTTTLQQDLLRASDRMERELSQSDPATVTLGSSVHGLSFASPYDRADDFSYTNGLLTWRRFVCYYINGQSQLVRVATDIPATTTIPSPTQCAGYSPDKMAAMTLSPDMLVGSIASMTVSLSAQTVSITLTAVGRDNAGAVVADSQGNAMDSVTLQDANVVLRN